MPWRYVGGHDLLVHLKLVLHLDVCVCGCVGGWVMVGDSTWGTLHGLPKETLHGLTMS